MVLTVVAVFSCQTSILSKSNTKKGFGVKQKRASGSNQKGFGGQQKQGKPSPSELRARLAALQVKPLRSAGAITWRSRPSYPDHLGRSGAKSGVSSVGSFGDLVVETLQVVNRVLKGFPRAFSGFLWFCELLVIF